MQCFAIIFVERSNCAIYCSKFRLHFDRLHAATELLRADTVVLSKGAAETFRRSIAYNLANFICFEAIVTKKNNGLFHTAALQIVSKRNFFLLMKKFAGKCRAFRDCCKCIINILLDCGQNTRILSRSFRNRNRPIRLGCLLFIKCFFQSFKKIDHFTIRC